MTEEQAIWQDVVVESGKWSEVARQHGLSDIQVRALDGRHNSPHISESKESLAMKFIVPGRVSNKLSTQWLNVFLTDGKIITFHHADFVAIDILRERVEMHEVMNKTPSGVLSLIADVVTEQFIPILDHVDDTIDKLVDVMAVRPSDDQLQLLFDYKQLLADLRRIALPTVSMLDGLQNGRYQLIDKEYANTYLRDSYAYAWRSYELIDTVRDLLTSALDTYLSVVSNRMNEVMKRLTIVATIFMPISFLTGFGGMNFTHLPFSSEVAMAVMLGLIILVPLSMLTYFKLKKWF